MSSNVYISSTFIGSVWKDTIATKILYVEAVYRTGVWAKRGTDTLVCIMLPEADAIRKSDLISKINKLGEKQTGAEEMELALLIKEHDSILGPSVWYRSPSQKCDVGQLFVEVPEYLERIG